MWSNARIKSNLQTYRNIYTTAKAGGHSPRAKAQCWEKFWEASRERDPWSFLRYNYTRSYAA
jgi:hypothetical protein